jgi:hypothetical protein
VLAAPPNVTSLRVNCLRTDVDSACRQLADHLQRAAPKAGPETTDASGDEGAEQPQREQAMPTVHPVLRDVIILPCTVYSRHTAHTAHITHTAHTAHTAHTIHDTHGTRHTTHDTRHTAHGTRHTAHGTRHTAHGTRHTAHGTRHTTHTHTHTQGNAQAWTHVLNDDRPTGSPQARAQVSTGGRRSQLRRGRPSRRSHLRRTPFIFMIFDF